MSGFVTLEKIIELKERNKIFSFCKNNLIIASRVYNVIESKRTKCTKNKDYKNHKFKNTPNYGWTNGQSHL